MMLNNASVGFLLVGTLLLSGCSSTSETVSPEPAPTPVEETSIPVSPSPTPSIEENQGEGELVPTGSMPVIIPRSEIPYITINGDYEISQKEALRVYEWAASLAWMSANDQNLRGEPSKGDELVQSLLPYLTDEATQRVLSTIRSWAIHPDPLNPDVFLPLVSQPMFFIASPDNGGLGIYEHEPVYRDIKISKPSLSRIENRGVAARYKLSFDVTAALYVRPDPDLCPDGGPYSCESLFYLGMAYPHDWEIVETGNPEAPFMLDSWIPATPLYGNLTPVSS